MLFFMRKRQITCRFDEKAFEKMDELIRKGKFDDYPSLVRRAVNEFLESQERVILA